MNSPKETIVLFNTMLSSNHLPYLIKNPNKPSYLQIRRIVINQLQMLITDHLINKEEEVFYLSLTYIDILFLNSNITNKPINQLRDEIIFPCLSLAVKFIEGVIITNRKIQLKEYEIKCLKLLDYQLIYATPYDYIKVMFASNRKLYYTAKTLLASFALNDTYINYPSSIIAFGLINYSIEIIGLPQKYLIAFDKHIHSVEANEFKNDFKHCEFKKKKLIQMKTMSMSNCNKNISKGREEGNLLSFSTVLKSKGDKNTYESSETSTSTLSNRSESNSPKCTMRRRANYANENASGLYTSSMNTLCNNYMNINLNYKQFSSINIANMSYLAKNYLSHSNYNTEY